MRRAGLILRLLRCYEGEREPYRRMRLGILILKLVAHVR